MVNWTHQFRLICSNCLEKPFLIGDASLEVASDVVCSNVSTGPNSPIDLRFFRELLRRLLSLDISFDDLPMIDLGWRFRRRRFESEVLEFRSMNH